MSTNKKRKKSIIPFIIFGLFICVFGYYCAGAMYPNATIFDWYNNLMNNVIHNLWVNYYNQYTIKTILVLLFVYSLFVLYYFAGQKNYMFGKEMGTAKFADPKSINKVLSNKNFSEDDPSNIVIYKTVYPFYMKFFINLKNKIKYNARRK